MNIKEINRCEPHSHSHFSNIRLLDSINRPEDMIVTAAQLGLKGIALTDHECLSGHVEWLQLEKKLKDKGKIPQDFKCMLGNEIYLTETRDKIQKYFHFILISKDTIGHRALRELSSIAWYNSYTDRRMERVPTLKKDLIDIVNKYKGHLIGTTACLGGELATLVLSMSKAANEGELYKIKLEIVEFINFGKELFGEDFYLEIAPAHSKEQKIFNSKIKDIAKATNSKIIIGTDAHYLTAEDRPIHTAYLNSKDGEREIESFYMTAHLMDNEEVFSYISDSYSEEEFNVMCENSMEIYDKVIGYDIFNKPIIPEVHVKDYEVINSDIEYPTLKYLLSSSNPQERYWINQCLDELERRELNNEIYLARLETEADVIKHISDKMGNCLYSYFNTFQHFIDLFWECESLSGPGRGSSVGFLSNYLLGITQLDPIEWDLMYWRFLNKERVELPDIDTDLSPSKRKLVFKKIREQRVKTHVEDYCKNEPVEALRIAAKGIGNLVQVATFGTEGTRSAILTACRGYRTEDYPSGIDSDIGQYLSSLIPQERGFLWEFDDVINGNEEKDRKPVKAFINEVAKYPGLLEIMLSIAGLSNKRSQHASGVMIYNTCPWETNAIMRSPNGDIITQFALHQSEELGDTKFDFLVTEICDKMTNCIKLLKDEGYFSECNSLREIYENYLHPSKLNLKDERIWDSLAAGTVMDVFQFNSPVGLQAAKTIKPKDPIQLTAANALMRLMAEKDKERPLDRYCRMKENIGEWYKEMDLRGISKSEQKILEPYYLKMFATPALQEDLMVVCMDKDISGFSLKESNNARKIVAKKQMSEIPKLKEDFISRCPNRNFGDYVWETVMGPQMGYAFSLLHSLAYSFVGIQTLVLATAYPVIYWNCACLITNSGGNEDAAEEEEEIIDLDEDEEIEEDDDEDAPKVKKTKARNTNYGKISTAIGQMQYAGISVSTPDINKSSYTFTPDVENDRILYGIKGINKIGADLIKEIMEKRPFSSIEDFLSRVKINKPQMINLIKSGAFDSFKGTKRDAMIEYIDLISDKKKRLTLQNMQMLIEHNLLPEELELEVKIFNFNKYLKKNKLDKFSSYKIDEVALAFYEKHFDYDLLFSEETTGGLTMMIIQSDWDKIYKKAMDPVRNYLKENLEIMLNKLNESLFNQMWDKYCIGNESKWEMDSISFYYGEHELENLNEQVYNVSNFFDAPEEPVLDRSFYIDGKEVKMFKLIRIAGTILDKDKVKSTISVLTKYGVVPIKIYQAQFAKYDKQISIRLPSGKKKVIEKSWFSRGNKLIFTGIRREDNFQLKKYKSTPHAVIELITEIGTDGYIETEKERMEV